MSLSVPLKLPSKEILHISAHYLVILVKYIYSIQKKFNSIWTYCMLIDRQMQSEIMPELHSCGFQSWPPGPHLQILHQEIFWSPW